MSVENAGEKYRKDRYISRGEGYYISVQNCEKHDVKEKFYWGPPVNSVGASDGFQIDGTTYQKPIMGESDRPIDRILHREVVVGYKTTANFEEISMFLKPTLCPEVAKKAQPRGRYIYIADSLDTHATCLNQDCPFNSNYKPPEKHKLQLERLLHLRKS